MHKSRVGVVVIDCETDDPDREARFRSAALGLEAESSQEADGANYRVLETAPEEMAVRLQKVDHPSRVHLDIETDDIEAPSGRRFCLVAPRRADFAEKATEWP